MSIPDLARELGADLRPALLALDRAGKVSLRREDFPDQLGAADRALCPDAHDGWPLSYATVR